MIGWAIVSNTDSCTFKEVRPENGHFVVDFDMQPIHEKGVVTDFIKFHFFTPDEVPVLIAAGAVHLESLTTGVHFIFENNFTGVKIYLDILKCEIHHDIALTPSCLHDSESINAKILRFIQYVQEAMHENMQIGAANGGTMFTSLVAAHNMQNEASSNLHYQQDFAPNAESAKRFLLTGLTMLSLLESMQVMHLTIDQVNALPRSGVEFTRFVSIVCQTCSRSADLCPYTADMNVSTSVDKNGDYILVPGESYKRPFGLPWPDNGRIHSVQTDDCEGEALWLMHLCHSFAHVKDYTKAELFPDHLFHVDESDKDQLMALGLEIGQLIADSLIQCDVVLVSASAPMLGAENSSPQLQGHATCVLVNMVGEPHEILMEGTNCLMPEMYLKKIQIQRPTGPKTLSMSSVANSMTKMLMQQNYGRIDCKMMAHLDIDVEKIPFYKNVFVQNNMFVATHGETKPHFGVSVANMNNYKIKVFLPMGEMFHTKMQKSIENYVDARRAEIHPPLAPLDRIVQVTKTWSPMTMFKGNDILKDRQYIVCLYSRALADPSEREKYHKDLLCNCDQWNELYPQIGFANSFKAYNSVYHTLCLYTDNVDNLIMLLEKEGKE